MFVRSCWKPQSIDDAYALIEAHPWALLVTNGDDGPWATNLPLLLDRGRGLHGVLTGHLSRANAHQQVLEETSEASLAIFHGPASYITPSWYPQRDMPGTYYYTAVHCYGRLTLQDDGGLESSLTTLSDQMESVVPDGWKVTEIPHSEITRRLPAIMGFELVIDRIEGKFKLGQDEPLKDALAVADHLAASSDPIQRQLATAVRYANLRRGNDESE